MSEFLQEISTRVQGLDPALGWALAAASLVMFVGTLLLVPVLVAGLPSDYFASAGASRILDVRGAAGVALLVGKNLLGLMMVLAGVTMLVLPGQGLLTLLVGVMLLNFPGKRRIECFVASRRPIRRALGWIRTRANKPPLEF